VSLWLGEKSKDFSDNEWRPFICENNLPASPLKDSIPIEDKYNGEVASHTTYLPGQRGGKR